MKTLDYVLTRECNRVNKDITSIYQLVGESRKLDEEAASEERVPEKGVAEARKELAEHLSKFAGLTGKYEKLTVLRPRPMTLGVLRLDGAPVRTSGARRSTGWLRSLVPQSSTQCRTTIGQWGRSKATTPAISRSVWLRFTTLGHPSLCGASL
jgi:hypothetical protein